MRCKLSHFHIYHFCYIYVTFNQMALALESVLQFSGSVFLGVIISQARDVRALQKRHTKNHSHSFRRRPVLLIKIPSIASIYLECRWGRESSRPQHIADNTTWIIASGALARKKLSPNLHRKSTQQTCAFVRVCISSSTKEKSRLRDHIFRRTDIKWAVTNCRLTKTNQSTARLF